MLPAYHRLPGSFIPHILSSGRYINLPSLYMIVSWRGDKQPSRIAALVPVKIARKAYMRNRIRRRIREAIRPHIAHLVPGYDALIIAREPALHKSVQTMTTTVKTLLFKGHLIK